MTNATPILSLILEFLERIYGPQKPAGPRDPYEMILYLNCGYPATDTSCSKGFDALKREVGLNPSEILAAPKAKLATLMRSGGIVPELRAGRLQEIARMVQGVFHRDLHAALKKLMAQEKMYPGKGVLAAKKALRRFPVIGEPSAEKILLFSKLAPVAAVPSAFVGVPVRLYFGREGKSYAANYRTARNVLTAGLPETFEARQRAYLLLKKHGQEICKRSRPMCEICPLTGQCAYIQSKASDRDAE